MSEKSDVSELELRRAAAVAKKQNKQFCYRCSCGSELFYLLPFGKIQCLECGGDHPLLLWGQHCPVPDDYKVT